MLLAPFTICPLAPCSFHIFAPCSFLTFSCSFFIFPCSLLLFHFSSCSWIFVLLHAPFWNFSLFHVPFSSYCAPCSRSTICLLPAPFSILGLAPCSFVPNRACFLLRDYPYQEFSADYANQVDIWGWGQEWSGVMGDGVVTCITLLDQKV